MKMNTTEYSKWAWLDPRDVVSAGGGFGGAEGSGEQTLRATVDDMEQTETYEAGFK